MTLPAFLFGVLVSTLMGAAFHLWKGGGRGRLILYVILGWVGFWVGHVLGNSIGWTFGSIGPLRLGMAVFAGLAVLFLGHWLSLVQSEDER